MVVANCRIQLLQALLSGTSDRLSNRHPSPWTELYIGASTDIVVIHREGIYLGFRFEVTVWANSKGLCSIESVRVDTLTPHKVSEWMLFGSLDEAYEHGAEIARQIIDS